MLIGATISNISRGMKPSILGPCWVQASSLRCQGVKKRGLAASLKMRDHGRPETAAPANVVAVTLSKNESHGNVQNSRTVV